MASASRVGSAAMSAVRAQGARCGGITGGRRAEPHPVADDVGAGGVVAEPLARAVSRAEKNAGAPENA